MAFVEQNCVIEHEGQRFESGGAWLCEHKGKPGQWAGIVYAKPDANVVTDWHGKAIAPARFGPIFQSAFCRMRCVSFTYQGKRFHGRYCPDWADAVRVRGKTI